MTFLSRHYLLLLLRLATSIGLIFLLMRLVNWRQGLDTLLRARVEVVVILGLFFPMIMAVSAARWGVLLRALAVDFKWLSLVRYYWVGFFFNNFLPSTLGGDISRVTFFRRSGKLAQAAASVVAERLTGIVALLAFAAAALLAVPDFRLLEPLADVLWLCIGTVLPVLLFCYFRGEKLADRLERFSSKSRFFSSWLKRSAKVAVSLGSFRGSPFSVAVALLLSVVFYVLSALFNMFLFIALGVEVPTGHVFAATPLIALAGMVPISINALGVTEGAFVVLFSQAGVAPAEALAAAVLARLLRIAASVVGGLLAAGCRRKSDWPLYAR